MEANELSGIPFRPYKPTDRDACLRLIDENTPAFFAPNERADYTAYLDGPPKHYWVLPHEQEIMAAFGFSTQGTRGRIQWIMTSDKTRGTGIGRRMMRLVIQIAEEATIVHIDIAASQLSAPFFARYGAKEKGIIPDGWGPGLDRVDMVLTL